MRKVMFAPDAIADLKKYKTGNQSLAFKVFELITDIQSNLFMGWENQNHLKGILQVFGRGESMMNNGWFTKSMTI